MLCSVFGCTCYSHKETIHFYRFPKREKSPQRYKVWVNFCKRKNFIPGKNNRICSSHFKSDDFNESDVLRKQLMPDTKVVIRLKSNVFPTIYKTKSDDPTLTLQSTSRCERQNRKKENQFTLTSFKSSTPVKKSKDELNILESQNEHSFDLSYNSIDFIQEHENNVNDIGVQCDLGSESVAQYLLKTNNELSFELHEDISEEESDEDDIDSYVDDNDLISKPNIDDDACFIIFWENILCLFKHCQECSTRNISMKHYIQGTFLSVTTVCEEGHTVQWTSQKKTGKRPEGNIVIGAALTLSGILFA